MHFKRYYLSYFMRSKNTQYRKLKKYRKKEKKNIL